MRKATTKATTKTAKTKTAKPAGEAAVKETKPKGSAKKKDAPLVLEDPDLLPPIVYKSRIGGGLEEKSKSLMKMAKNVRDSINIISERSKKRPVNLQTPAQLRRAIMPYDELSFQFMLGSIGFRAPVAIEIVAPEKIGATTFVMDLIGRIADMGCYSGYCECEGKPMSDRRIKRLLDRDPSVAVMKMNSVMWANARTLAEFDNTLRKTVVDLRKRCDADPVTKGNPIFFIADPWGALMSKGEAKGNSDWGLAANAKPEDPKDTTDGSNFEHAKHAQGMARWLPAFMEKYNCTVIFVNKQNDKIEMTASPLPSYMQPSPIKNDTRIGGRALKRLCAYRLTMMKLGDIREKTGEKRTYGHHVRMMAVANSYGPRDRTCEFSIYFDLHDDRPGYQAPGLSFDNRTASWMVSKKFLGTTSTDDLYTCDALGCVAVSPEELVASLRQHPQHYNYIGAQLGIEGYESMPTVEAAVLSDEETLIVPN